MRKSFKFILGTIILLTFIALGIGVMVLVRYKNSPAIYYSPPLLSTEDCPNKFTVSRGGGFTALLNEQDRANVSIIQAVVIDPFKYLPMTLLEKFHLEEDIPFLWATPDRKEAVIDQRFFGDLYVVDVTSEVREGKEKQIGIATPELLRRLPLSVLTRFLIDSQVIKTYWHLGATLCPTRENQTADIYEQTFHGKHSYCTSECYTKAYNFTVRINKKTGAITVQ